MKSRITLVKKYQERGIIYPMKNIIFLKDNYPFDFPFSETEKELGIVFFDKSLFHKSELRKGIYVNRLNTIVLRNDSISISFLSDLLQIKNNRITFYVGEGTTCKYVLNCKTKEWEKREEEDWGI